MRKISSFCILFLAFLPFGQTQRIFSPDHVLELEITQSPNGEIRYNLSAEGFKIIQGGKLGFILNENQDFYSHFKIDSAVIKEHNTSWETVWGEVKTIHDHHNSLQLYVTQSQSSKRMMVEFSLFNDGLGFRYNFLVGSNLDFFIVKNELTSFALQEDYSCFWIPGDYDSNEYRYNKSRLSSIDALQAGDDANIAFRHNVHDSLVQTPLMCQSDFAYSILIHEAALRHYPAMQLDVNRQSHELTCHLVPDVLGNKAYLQEGDVTPWRVVLFAKKNKELLTNRIILNLNEANSISDASFIKPGKFVGVWWEMHVGKSSWNYWNVNNSFSKQYWQQAQNHGANTKNVMRYIDFASRNNIPYVLVEGWNEGWENWFGRYREHIFSFTKPYPDFDIEKINSYAKKKNVQLIMHHETSGAVTDYERQLDSALALMQQYNYAGIKGGYVGNILPRGEHHDGQWMVDHYERLARTMAAHKFPMDLHESVRPTGLQRTYPNWWSNEAARGNEFNAWSKGNLPEHETILPFTRLMGGPMDYTPGIFKIKMSDYDASKTEQVHTTLAKQLALYITMYSPIQMAADLIENYEKKPDAFEFIKNVPTDWDTTVVIDAEPGDYIYMARKQRNANNWYLGAITDEQERNMVLDFSFLEKGKKYKLKMYKDAAKASWNDNPEAYEIETKTIRSTDKISIRLAPGGGCAMELVQLGK